MAIEFLDSLNETWQTLGPVAQGLIESVAVVVVCLVVRGLILRFVHGRVEDSRAYYTWRKGTQYIFMVLGLVLITSIWFQGTGDVATFFGLLSAGVAVALRDPLANIVGWIYIMWQRPFGVGDRVEINNKIGDVVDQRFFSWTMLEVGNWTHGEQSTGRVTHVPNSLIFAHPLFNYTEPFEFIWDEIAVVLTFESDWMSAKRAFKQVADDFAADIIPDAKKQLEQTSQRTLINYSALSPIVYTSVVDVGVKLTIRHLIPTRRRRSEQERLWEAVLHHLEETPSAELAYPTQRLIADGVADFRVRAKRGAAQPAVEDAAEE